MTQQLGGCSAFLLSPLLFTRQIYPLHPGLSWESNMDTRGLENDIIGRQDEKIYLFSEEERNHFSKATLFKMLEKTSQRRKHTVL